MAFSKFLWAAGIKDYQHSTINRIIGSMRREGYIIPENIREMLTPEDSVYGSWRKQIAGHSEYQMSREIRSTGGTHQKKINGTVSGAEAYEFKQAAAKLAREQGFLKNEIERKYAGTEGDAEAQQQKALELADLTKYDIHRLGMWKKEGETEAEAWRRDFDRILGMLRTVDIYHGGFIEEKHRRHAQQIGDSLGHAMHQIPLTDPEFLKLRDNIDAMTPTERAHLMEIATDYGGGDIYRAMFSYDPRIQYDFLQYLARAYNTMADTSIVGDGFSPAELSAFADIGSEIVIEL